MGAAEDVSAPSTSEKVPDVQTFAGSADHFYEEGDGLL